MPIGPARMPIMAHLSELRMRLARIVVSLLIAVCVFYMATPTIAQFLLQPVSEFMPRDTGGNIALNVFGAFDAFSVRFFIALWTSVVACMPIILWQILAFFLPALKPNERKWFVPTFAAAIFLFFFGVVFCYFIILNPAFEWLTDQASGFAIVLPEARMWLDIILKFEIGFGLAFELPLIIFYLVLFDFVSYAKLRKSWRSVYIALMVLSAMVTPDASPITMALMFLAMVGLYEASMLVARMALRKRISAQAEALLQEESVSNQVKQESNAYWDAIIKRQKAQKK